MTAVKGPAEVAVARVKAAPGFAAQPFVVRPEEVGVKIVGRENWTREINDILVGDPRVSRMLIGETFNPPGNWSSYPPHRHEKDEPPDEVKLEEVYYFRLKPAQGFGVQRIYTDDRAIDETYALEDGDVTIMPRGYHPVAAAAGYRLYYLWVLAGMTPKMLPRAAPAPAWVKDQAGRGRDVATSERDTDMASRWIQTAAGVQYQRSESFPEEAR